MARAIPPSKWERGFKEPSSGAPWVFNCTNNDDDDSDDGYITAPSKEVVTSTIHNDLGINVLRTWPTIYDGTNDPHGLPAWWNPPKEVDVLICGAGPSGLAVATSLARQGVSFRIIDKAEGPLIAGRADGVQPRFLEILHTWGLAKEVHEEGPLIERTAIYKDGKKLFFDRSHQSDSRYRGLHIITQGQVERIYIRDLLRHHILVERSTTLKEFNVSKTSDAIFPIAATLNSARDGKLESIRAKFLVGSDGASSQIRKSLAIPYDGMSTNIYWGIMDCIYSTDYPHAWVFGSVINSKHGGCVIIPREDGYIRLYTQLDVSQTGTIAASRRAEDPTIAESGGQIDINSITADEILAQANRIFSPYKLKFAAPLSWFAIWKISERVARTFSSPDQRVHLIGDAAHVHSVMGAFGLNASIMDASNLAWKIGLICQGKAKMDLLPTYDHERHEQAIRIIEASGEYLRFVCATDLEVPSLRNLGDSSQNLAIRDHKPQENEKHTVSQTVKSTTNGTAVNGTAHTNGHKEENPQAKDLAFLADFFGRNGKFLLGIDAPFDHPLLSAPVDNTQNFTYCPRPVLVRNGVRAPNPRVCFSTNETGYLYDKLTGAATLHLVIFASTLTAKPLKNISKFASAVLRRPNSFYHRYGGADLFNIVVVLKGLPVDVDSMMHGADMELLRKCATVVYDDRAPDEDAHTMYGADHSTGAVVFVRPDLWVGISVRPDDVDSLTHYFDGFLIPQ